MGCGSRPFASLRRSQAGLNFDIGMVALLSAILIQFQPEAALGRILPAALAVAPVAVATSYAPPDVDPDRPLFVAPVLFFEPVVDVPGYKPVPDLMARTRAMLAAVERMRIEGIADVARFMAGTGMNMDYSLDGRGNRVIGLRLRLPVPGM